MKEKYKKLSAIKDAPKQYNCKKEKNSALLVWSRMSFHPAVI